MPFLELSKQVSGDGQRPLVGVVVGGVPPDDQTSVERKYLPHKGGGISGTTPSSGNSSKLPGSRS